MTDIRTVQDVIWNDYFKIAWVDLLTGEYEFLKNLPTEEEQRSLACDSIYDYFRTIAESGLIDPEDTENYLNSTSREYVLNEVLTKKKHVTVNFRHTMSGRSSTWIKLEIIPARDFSVDNPRAAITWKGSEQAACTVEDAMRMLSQCFHKILRVDLTTDRFEVVKAQPGDFSAGQGYSDRFSEWLRNSAAIGNIYGEDIRSYTEFTNVERLKRRFRESKECLRFRYRRRYNGEFRWVYMELLPSVEYTEDDQVVILYIRDIHDDYVDELHRQKALEYYCNYDTLTGVRSRFCYNNFCRSFEQGNMRRLAVLFADVNGLKYTNDTMGHECGDQLITGFAEMISSAFGTENCYRISGDEFVVLLEDTDRDEFMTNAEKFHTELQRMEFTMASVGAAWSDNAKNVDYLMKIAEARMYEDKREFYKIHPEMKR
ncbi:MAG: GGDEF domain-containing protein [Oscillospiraceae bacterium]